MREIDEKLFEAQTAEEVRELVKQGADVNVRDEIGNLPIVFSANAEVAEALIEAGAAYQWFPTDDDDVKISVLARYLLENDENALPEVVEVFIKAGADVNAQTVYAKGILGETPLMEACSYGNAEIVKLLLDAGAVDSINTLDVREERTAFLEAANNGSVEIMDMLVKNGAKLDVCDAYGYTPLMLAAGADSFEANPEAIDFLIAQKVNLDERDNEGCTALMHATQSRSYKAVKALVKAGTDIDIEDNDGYSPLQFAVEKQEEVLEDIANKNEQQQDIMYEQSIERSKIITLLIEAKKDKRDKNNAKKKSLQDKKVEYYDSKKKNSQISECVKSSNMKISGTVIADMIAERVKAGVEKRTITPAIGQKLRQEIMVAKYARQ